MYAITSEYTPAAEAIATWQAAAQLRSLLGLVRAVSSVVRLCAFRVQVDSLSDLDLLDLHRDEPVLDVRCCLVGDPRIHLVFRCRKFGFCNLKLAPSGRRRPSSGS